MSNVHKRQKQAKNKVFFFARMRKNVRAFDIRVAPALLR